jgi:hypothetical protein
MNWFTPKCPVDGETKDWLEECFLWFFEEFGETAFRESKLVLPTAEFIPEVNLRPIIRSEIYFAGCAVL